MSDSNHTGNGNGNKDFGLPSHPEIERYVLGAILVSDSETATIWDMLDTSDFAVRDHQTIYRRMRALHKRGTALDYATVGAELQTHGELQVIGGLGTLVDLDRGAPELRHVGRYIEIVAEDARRRRMIHAGNALMLAAADPLLDPALLLREHRERLEEMETNEQATLEGGDVWSYEATESYLVEGLIAENAITMFSAESGAGKSLLLLAMAAAVARGTAFAGRETKPRSVIYIDREMPLFTVKKRLREMGIERLYPRLRILGGWEKSEPPGPAARELLASARQEQALFVFDPLDCFLNCDENDSSQVRAHMKLYRKLCDTGGSVILAHHKSDKSEALYRGSSALRGGIDTGWYLSRDSEALTEDLKRATLTAFKTRNGARPALRLSFENGTFHSLDTPSRAPVDIIVELVYSHPGSCQKDLISLGKRQGISEHGVQVALQAAVLDRRIELRQKRPRATARYYPSEGRLEAVN